MAAEIEVMRLQEKGPRDCPLPPGARKRQGQMPLYSLQRELRPANPLSLDFQSPQK